MLQGRISRRLRVAALAGVFGAGYLCGTLGPRWASAGMDALQKGGGSFGPFGQLETSIVDMQQHVDGLDKGLETLRKVDAGPDQ
jgi:hypothetical protein